MKIDTFLLERNQTLYENDVELNLTESGIHPCTVNDILQGDGIEDFLATPLGYGYTDGTPELRARIADWYPTAKPENIAVTQGASEANLISVMSVVSPGDEILFILPNFLQISGLAKSFGIAVKTVELSPENGWQPDLDALAAAVTPKTKMIALVNPNNPTGIVHTEESMRGVAAIAEKCGAYLLSDEIYRGAEIDRPETPTYYGIYDRVIVTSSLSKAFANPGLRLGWIVAPTDVITEAMRRQDYTSIGTNRLSQVLGERILEPNTRDRLLSRTRSILSGNIKILSAWMEKHHNQFSMVRPEAGGMAFLGYNLSMSSEEFSTKLREEESLFVVAGSWFGLENHIRLGLGVETEHLEEALVRLARFADRHTT